MPNTVRQEIRRYVKQARNNAEDAGGFLHTALELVRSELSPEHIDPQYITQEHRDLQEMFTYLITECVDFVDHIEQFEEVLKNNF